MLRQLLLAGVVLLPIGIAPVQAAEITINAVYDDTTRAHLVSYVTVAGRIDPGDDEKFRQATQKLPSEDVRVVLNSGGGSVLVGLAIGEIIHQRRWSTLVDTRCASTCALIWLAGMKRWAAENSLGFHAAANPLTGLVSGAGCALIGAYLNKLGFGSATIFYLMHAAPNQIEWLDDVKARRYGIAIDTLQDTWIPYLGN